MDYDKEVERYVGFQGARDCSNMRLFSSVTPGRLKASQKCALKRPSSACAVSSPERNYLLKSDTVGCHTPCSKSKRRTPISSTRKNKRTPISKIHTPKTPKTSDRFIPPRESMNFAASHYKILHGFVNNENDASIRDVSKQKFEKGMQENLTKILGDSNTRILTYQSRLGTPLKGNCSPVKGPVSDVSSCKKLTRKIPVVPERVLDAPNYVDDYYLNLLHWSSSVDLLAVALDNSVYVWTPSTGDINHLCELPEPESYVTSVQWAEEGCHLAIGTVNGTVQLWDVEHKKRLRQMSGHAARVSCLSWNAHILSSGSRSGEIHNHDVRIAEHHIGSYLSHSQEVCGLSWSPSGRYLASGSNNNKLMIWDHNDVNQSLQSPFAPVHCFTKHRAAVKALAWCPWQNHVLASGGGSADKTICFWNINSGQCLNTIETGSQVSSLLWSDAHKELISGHGYPDNQLSIWQYPSMTKKADLLGHTSRVLQMTMSPDKSRVMSSAGDETLRLWHCFELTKEKKMRKKRNDVGGLLSLTSIR